MGDAMRVWVGEAFCAATAMRRRNCRYRPTTFASSRCAVRWMRPAACVRTRHQMVVPCVAEAARKDSLPAEMEPSLIESPSGGTTTWVLYAASQEVAGRPRRANLADIDGTSMIVVQRQLEGRLWYRFQRRGGSWGLVWPADELMVTVECNGDRLINGISKWPGRNAEDEVICRVFDEEAAQKNST
jgi:hypothetical protein